VPVYFDQDDISAPRMRPAVGDESLGHFCYILGPDDQPLTEDQISSEMDQLENDWAQGRSPSARLDISPADVRAIRVAGLEKFEQFLAEPSWERGTSFTNWVDTER
jgi:hypothetical protein